MATGVTVRNINIAVNVDAKSAIAQLTRLEATLKSIGNASLMTSLSSEIKKIKGEAESAKKSVSDLSSAISKLKDPTVKVRTETEKAYNPIQKLSKLVKRILVYRTIRQALMFIGNSLRAGLNMVKEYSSLVKTSGFTEMFSTYDAMALETKATLGVAFASILETVQPIALALTNALQFIAEAISQFNAALNKQDTYLKVNTDYVKEYTQAVKDAKRQVMGFDEINKISTSAEIDYERLYDPTELSSGMIALGAAIELATTAMAAEGIAGFVTNLTSIKKAVNKVTKAVGDKNTALGNESTALDLDAQKAGALSGALVGAGGLLFGIKTLVDYLEKHPISVPIDIPLTAFDGIKTKFEEIKTEISLQAILIPIVVQDFVADVAEKLKNIGIDIAAKSFTIAVKVYDFVAEAKTSLEEIGKEIAAKSFTIVVKICDFVTDLKTKLGEAGAAIKGFFANLFTKEATGAGETVAGDIIPSSGHPVLNSDANEDLKKALGVAAVAALGGAVIAGIAKSSGGGVGGGGGAFYKILGFASGGYPSAGSMFIAGEAGPEIVGSINGKTGVASGDEVTGIRTAVYSIGEAIVSAINNKDTNAVVRLDDGSIYKASQRGAKRVGNSLISFAN